MTTLATKPSETAISENPEAAEACICGSPRIVEALCGRVVIERAKGVLAELENLDMAAAFDRLVQRSQTEDLPLTTIATKIAYDTHAH